MLHHAWISDGELQQCFTSFGNRDECVTVLLSDCDGRVWNLGQQVHQITHPIIHHLPVPGETPDIHTDQEEGVTANASEAERDSRTEILTSDMPARSP